MQLAVTGRHITVTESVKIYAGDKLRNIVDKHLPDRITKAHIILYIEKYRHVVEAELHGPQINIYGKVSTTSMYTSIDKVMEKVEKQLVKYKKRYDRHKHVKAQRTIRLPAEEM